MYLEVDSTSARTLPFLDSIYKSGDMKKLAELIANTPADARRRLTLAALARNLRRAPAGEPPNNNAAKLVEELILMNFSGNAELIPQVLDQAGSGERLVLTVSLMRYNSYDSVDD